MTFPVEWRYNCIKINANKCYWSYTDSMSFKHLDKISIKMYLQILKLLKWVNRRITLQHVHLFLNFHISTYTLKVQNIYIYTTFDSFPFLHLSATCHITKYTTRELNIHDLPKKNMHGTHTFLAGVVFSYFLSFS